MRRSMVSRCLFLDVFAPNSSLDYYRSKYVLMSKKVHLDISIEYNEEGDVTRFYFIDLTNIHQVGSDIQNLLPTFSKRR